MIISCVYDKEDEFIYYPVTKVCIHSITYHALKDRAVVYSRDPILWQEKCELVKVENLFKMAFVRNPFDRAVSAFLYLQRQKIILKEWDFSGYIIHMHEENKELDHHFNLQTLGFEVASLDFLGKFESLQTDWQIVARKLSVPEELGQFNQTKRELNSVASYYTEKVRDLIIDRYELDFELLKYSLCLPE